MIKLPRIVTKDGIQFLDLNKITNARILAPDVTDKQRVLVVYFEGSSVGRAVMLTGEDAQRVWNILKSAAE